MKTGLVLEGGGLRGAYTAGALSWFLKEGIEFDYGVGISSGAQHLCNFVIGDEQYLKDIAIKLGTDALKVGIKPLLKEGQLVGYDALFDYGIEHIAPMDFKTLKESDREIEIGVFDLEAGKTKWVKKDEVDEDYKYLKAAILIPIAGKPIKIDGKKYVDAGVEHMIPIHRRIQKGVDKHIVITTKPQSYERSETGLPTKLFMSVFYRKYKVFRDYVSKRKDIYYEQKECVDKLVKQNQALELYPSQSFDIGRFGGDTSQLEGLYNLGFEDCENRREEIYRFLNLTEGENHEC